MGIRINKTIGYGMKFENDEDFNLIDLEHTERINELTSEGLKDIFKNELMTYRLNVEFCNLQEDKLIENLYNSMVHIYTNKEDLPSIPFIIVTSNSKDNHRHDDLIDYYEHDGVVTEPIFKDLPFGIYPHNGLFVDTRDLSPVKHGINLVKTINKLREKGLIKDIDEILKITQFSNYEEYQKYCRSKMDDFVYGFLKYIGLFKNEKDIYRLSPMIVTYWT